MSCSLYNSGATFQMRTSVPISRWNQLGHLHLSQWLRSSYVIHLLPHFYVDFFKIYFSWCLLFTWRLIRLVWLAHASLIKFSARSRSATVAFVFCDWLSMRAFCLTATGVLNASWGTGTSRVRTRESVRSLSWPGFVLRPASDRRGA